VRRRRPGRGDDRGAPQLTLGADSGHRPRAPSVSTITAPKNFAKDQANNEVSINATGDATVSPVNSYGTTYDSATRRLRAQAPTPSGAHPLYLSVFDQGDHILDSALFIDNLVVADDATCLTGQVAASDTGSEPTTPAVSMSGSTPTSATFTFGPPPTGGSFICQIKEGSAAEASGEPFKPCTSPLTVEFNQDLRGNTSRLFPGVHTLSVAGLSSDGTPDQTPQTFEFTVPDSGSGTTTPTVTPAATVPAPPTPASAAKKCKKSQKLKKGKCVKKKKKKK